VVGGHPTPGLRGVLLAGAHHRHLRREAPSVRVVVDGAFDRRLAEKFVAQGADGLAGPQRKLQPVLVGQGGVEPPPEPILLFLGKELRRAFAPGPPVGDELRLAVLAQEDVPRGNRREVDAGRRGYVGMFPSLGEHGRRPAAKRGPCVGTRGSCVHRQSSAYPEFGDCLYYFLINNLRKTRRARRKTGDEC